MFVAKLVYTDNFPAVENMILSDHYTNRMCSRYTIGHGSSNKQTEAKTTQGEVVVLATAGTCKRGCIDKFSVGVFN